MSARAPASTAHLNLNVWGLPRSPTLAIDALSREIASTGKRVYRLGLGQSPFPVPECVVQRLRDSAHQKEYLPVEGLPALREAVAAYYRAKGVEREAEGTLVGPGSKELMFLLQLTYYGDLIIPTPSWVSYAPQAQIAGRPIRWLQTHAEHGWRLTPAELDALCREDPDKPRLLILNYPSNPTGLTYDSAQLEAIADVARRYRVILLSDEIYGELDYAGTHVSVARYYPEGTIISSGLSKWCGAGGWRLGTFAFPPQLDWLQRAMAAVASETFTSTSAPIQYAAVRAFERGPDIDHYLLGCRAVLGALGGAVARDLRRASVRVDDPVGGFYVFPEFTSHRERLAARGITTSAALCERILAETGVAFLPGVAFGRAASELTARIAFVDFDGAAALAAAQTLGETPEIDRQFLQEHCRPVLDAIERIAGWLAA